jgi:hypothetical protein
MPDTQKLVKQAVRCFQLADSTANTDLVEALEAWGEELLDAAEQLGALLAPRQSAIELELVDGSDRRSAVAAEVVQLLSGK